MKIKGLVWLGRDNPGGYLVAPLAHPPKKIDDEYWEQRSAKGAWVDLEVCASIMHKVFPHIRLKPGAGPVRVMMLGLPLDGLDKEQIQTLRDAADDLEAVCAGMRSEVTV